MKNIKKGFVHQMKKKSEFLLAVDEFLLSQVIISHGDLFCLKDEREKTLLIAIRAFNFKYNIYMRISPRYSRAPSPRPLYALGDAHFNDDFAFILLMIAPGCSVSSAPDLYNASLTQTP